MKKPTFNSVFKKIEQAIEESKRLSDLYEEKEDYDSPSSLDSLYLQRELISLLESFSHRVGEKP